MTSTADTLTNSVTLAHQCLAAAGFPAPSPALLRARVMYDHARNARDLGRGWPGMLHCKTHDLEALDAAEASAAAAYLAAVNVERAGGDLLAGSASPAELTMMLRRAQAQRDEAVAEALKYETRLAIAEIAINSAQQENRAPIWPPVSKPAVDPDPADRMIAPIDPSAGVDIKFVAYEWKDATGWSHRVG